MNAMMHHIAKSVAVTVLLSTATITAAQIGPIRISVNVAGGTDVKRAKPPKKGGTVPKATITQDKQLEITLANLTPTDYKGLTVKYYMFAKDLAGKEISIPHTGAENVDLHGLGSAKVKSETLVTTYTTQYTKKTHDEQTLVPEQGEKYLGYGVQVLSGDAVLAETFEPPDLKGKLSTAWVEPPGGKKKKSKKAQLKD